METRLLLDGLSARNILLPNDSFFLPEEFFCLSAGEDFNLPDAEDSDFVFADFLSLDDGSIREDVGALNRADFYRLKCCPSVFPKEASTAAFGFEKLIPKTKPRPSVEANVKANFPQRLPCCRWPDRASTLFPRKRRAPFNCLRRGKSDDTPVPNYLDEIAKG